MRACLAPDDFGYGLAAGVAGLKVVPVVYSVFSLLPAPEDLPPIELAVEIDQPVLEPLEHAADLLQLEQVVLDLVRDRLDCAAQVELLFRLAPIGPRLSGGELVLVDQVAPLGMEGRDVGDDPPHEREGPVGFGEAEVLVRHDGSYAGTKSVGWGEWYVRVRNACTVCTARTQSLHPPVLSNNDTA